jgi:putative CocE/NonD family hydrolase
MKQFAGILFFSIIYVLSTSVHAQNNYSVFNQKVPVAGYAGKNFRFSASVKTNDNDNSLALLHVTVDRKSKSPGFSDNMLNRPIKALDWTRPSIEGKMDADADSMILGGIVIGNGSFYFDDFKLSVETAPGSWSDAVIVNNSFENSQSTTGIPQGWTVTTDNAHFTYGQAGTSATDGKYSLTVKGKGMEEDPGLAHYTKMMKYVQENYNKLQFRIPMRDGVKLFTNVYVPKDASATNKYPLMLNRTPYSVGPYEADKYNAFIGSETMVKSKYIFVQQDVRGRYMSEGVWTNMTPHIVNKKSNKDVDESSDTYDAIEFLLKNIPNNNGRVGQSGISYPGFYSSAGSIDAHPALKAVSPQAPVADFYWDDFHHNGVFTQGYFWNFPIFGTRPDKPTESDWYKLFDKPTPDAYDFYKRNGTLKQLGEKYYKDNFLWKEITEHPNYDTFWKSRRIVSHLRNLKPAYLVVGGWFDAEDLYGALVTYKEIEKNNPGIYNIITMGPFGHGNWSQETGQSKHYQLYWGDSLATFYQRDIEAKFFDHFLKGPADGKTGLPDAYMFNTGNKVYEQFNQWPPANTEKKRLYFQPKEGLSFTAPAAGGFSEYVSDPNKPVPYTMDIEGSFQITPRNYMSEDQRFAGRRTDVLVFETEPLSEDITLGGELMAKLQVSTTGTDADWVVKLIDVYPGDEKNSPYTDKGVTLAGYQHMVRSEIMRSRFRNSFEKPEPMVANKITPINFALQDVLHTFKKGHRIMVQVQSTWFPAFDRNPQKYVPNIYKAEASDFIKATQRVYHNATTPSYLEVSVMKVSGK